MRKVAVLLVLAMGAALVAALSLDSEPRVEKIPRPLVAMRLIPAGTPGERIRQENLYQRDGTLPPREHHYQEDAIYDWAYLRGRVAIVDILPGAQLQKAYFRRP